MFRYARRLDQDLTRWQAAGWVTPTHADRIRADIASRGTGVRLSSALGTLAAILIGFAAMSFVAANWQSMSKLARLGVIFAGLWSFLGLAYAFAERGLQRFSDAALLAATALYGAGIMLIAQMYHMDGHPPDAVWLWALGTVLVGLLLRSNTVLAAALVLFCVWSFMEMTSGFNWISNRNASRVHWGFLPAWVSVALGVALTRWRPGMHLLAAALSGWLIFSGYMIGRGDAVRGHLPVLLVGLGLMGASIAYGEVIDRWRQISGAMLNYGMVVAFAGAFALQFVVDRPSVGQSGTWTMLLGLVTLMAIAAAIAWAWRTDNRAAMWIAYGCFTVEVFSLYLKKVGTLLGTSGFFLMTGLLVAAFAYAAWRLNESKAETRTAS
jgi:uncharacterized membrane protein